MRKMLLFILSIILALAVFLLIATPIIAILFSGTILILFLLLTEVLDFKRLEINLKIKRAHSTIIILIFALISGLIISIGIDFPTSTGTSLEFITSLSLSQFGAIFAGLYITVLFPGLLAVGIWGLPSNNRLISLTFILSFSYIISSLAFSIIGMIFHNSGRLVYVLAVLILSIFIVSTFHYTKIASKFKNVFYIENHNTSSEIATGILTALVTLSAMLIVLVSEPTDYALSGDVARYIASGENYFAGKDLQAGYAWLQILLVGFHRMTGLYSYQAYLFLQIFVALTPLAIYTFASKLCPEKPWTAFLSTLLSTIAFGYYFVFTLFLASLYFSGPTGSWTALNLVMNSLGMTSLDTQILTTQGLDIGLSLIALSYAIHYFRSEDYSTISLFLAAMFLAGALLTHNLFYSAVVIFLLIIRYLRKGKKLFLLIVCSLSMFIVFEFCTLFPVIGYFMLYIDVYLYWFVYAPIISRFLSYLVILIAILPVIFTILFLFYRKGLLSIEPARSRLDGLSSRILGIYNRTKASVFTKLLGFIILSLVAISFILALIYGISGAALKPWYVLVIRDYGTSLTILSLGLIVGLNGLDQNERNITLLWLVSTISIASLGFILPSIFSPELWTRRLFIFITIPLCFMASEYARKFAMRISNKTSSQLEIPESFSYRISTKVIAVSILLIISLSSVSYAQKTELYYTGNYGYGTLNPNEAEVYDWIQMNTPTNSIILTFSEISRLRLSSICQREIIAHRQSAPEGRSNFWIMNIIFESKDVRTVLSGLIDLGVDYVVLFERDLNAMKQYDMGRILLSLLSGLEVSYSSEVAFVFNTSSISINDNSNLVLVQPTLDSCFQENYNQTYGLGTAILLSTQSSISIVDDLNLLQLESSTTYVFEGSTNLLHSLFDESLSSLPHNTTLVFMKTDFASFDEFGISLFDGGFLNQTGIKPLHLLNASSIEINDLDYILPSNLFVPNYSWATSNATVHGFYRSTTGDVAPLIIEFPIGNGRVFFCNLRVSELYSLDQSLNSDLLSVLSDIMIEDSYTETTESNFVDIIPQPFLDLEYPTMSNILKCPNLSNNIAAFSDVQIHGDVNLVTDRVIISKNQLNVSNLTITYQNGSTIILISLDNVSLQYSGFTDMEFISSSYSIFRTGTGSYFSGELEGISSLNMSIESHESAFDFLLGEEELVEPSFQGTITIEFATPYTSMSLICRTPTITVIDTQIEMLWVGLVWHSGTAFTTASVPQNWLMHASMTMKFTYASGGIFVSVESVLEIRVEVST